MNKIILIILSWMISQTTWAQVPAVLTIDSCYARARQNYPLLKQMELVTASMNYTIENASKGYYPQLSINGQATYQSDVTQVPISLPNVSPISKDQYKIYGDLSQTLYDGGLVKLQKEAILANATIEKQNIEVELYKLRERINQVFFGVLLLNEQLQQAELMKKDIQSGIDRTNAAIANGVGLKSSADVLQAEMLRVGQHVIELKSARKAYLDMLGLFIQGEVNENTRLETPPGLVLSHMVQRPELLYYDYKTRLLDIQQRQIDARSKPKVNLFVQGGYGRPALNMLNNEFDLYYIGGIRFTWSLSGLYTAKNEKAVLGLNYRYLEAQRETFLFNTTLATRQQDEEILKLEELLRTDDEIIALRTRIKNTALVQFENGVINANDYLREVNAEDQAKQNQFLHRIQLLMAQYKKQNTIGN